MKRRRRRRRNSVTQQNDAGPRARLFFCYNRRVRFDFDAPLERAGTWSTRWERYAGRDVIPLWVADSDFRAPPCILEALQKRIEHGVLGYTSAPEELREAIVERLERLYRWRIEPSWIVFLPGVVPGLHLAARKLLPPEGHALIPTPVYQHFKRAVELAPRAYTELRLVLQDGRWVFDEDAIKQSIRRDTKLFFLCNPQNPGGTVFTRAELERIAELARGLVIVSDEIHCELVLERDLRHVPIASLAPEISRRTVTLMSPNKAFNFPASGCAWAIIENAALRHAFSIEVTAHVLHSPSVFGYVAALAAYARGDEWLAAEGDYPRADRGFLGKENDLPMAHGEGTHLAGIHCSFLRGADPHS